MFRSNYRFQVFTEELYPFTGFGILDKSSIRKEKEGFKADYKMDDQVVLTVTKTNIFYLEDLFDGQKIRDSGGISLEIAVQYAYGISKLTLDDRYLHLMANHLSLPNMYTDLYHPKADFTPAFVPEVLRLAVEIIVTESNSKNLVKFLKKIENRELTDLKFLRQKEMVILSLLNTGDVSKEQVNMIEFYMPLALAPIYFPIMRELNIIPKGSKKYMARNYLLNYDLNNCMNRIHHIEGDEKEIAFMWVRNEQDMKNENDVIERFRMKSYKMLQSLSE
jgi:hypothetical protein